MSTVRVILLMGTPDSCYVRLLPEAFAWGLSAREVAVTSAECDCVRAGDSEAQWSSFGPACTLMPSR